MGIRDRIEKANAAARDVHERGEADRKEQRRRQDERVEAARKPAREGRQKLSEVDRGEDGELRCPNCGGQQFTAKRSKKGKTVGVLTVGIGALAAPKSQVKCVTCGEMFRRG